MTSAIASARDALDETPHKQGAKLSAKEIRHTVEQHGPQIPAEAQVARLIWLKDPAGEEGWHMTPEGGARTKHWVGTTTGGFTSPEALAKPINALLRVANEHAGGLSGLLTSKADDTRIAVHVSAEQCGLEPGDIAEYRAVGTSTQEMRSDWLAARRYSMRDGGPPVHVTSYDPVLSGQEPGAMLVFKHSQNGWRLTTCFPVDQQRSKTKRLEDLI